MGSPDKGGWTVNARASLRIYIFFVESSGSTLDLGSGADIP